MPKCVRSFSKYSLTKPNGRALIRSQIQASAKYCYGGISTCQWIVQSEAGAVCCARHTYVPLPDTTIASRKRVCELELKVAGISFFDKHVTVRFGSVPACRDTPWFFTSATCYAKLTGRERPAADVGQSEAAYIKCRPKILGFQYMY